jgi:hypothetical protein
MDEHELGEVHGCKDRSRLFPHLLMYELLEKALHGARLGQRPANVNQWRQDISQDLAARWVKSNVAADLDAVLTLAKPCGLVLNSSEQTGRVNWSRGQISRENEGAFRGQQEYVSRLDAHGLFLAIHAEPAFPLHQGEELDVVGLGKANRP